MLLAIAGMVPILGIAANAYNVYTDWKRLRMVYGTEWGGLVQAIEGMIEVFDCAIDVTEYVKAGCYISTDMFEEMKKL